LNDEECLKMYGGDLATLIDPKTRNTLLHTAAFYGCVDVLKNLIAKGLPVNIRNKAGDSALDIARRKHFSECAQLLQDAASRESNESIDRLVNELGTGNQLSGDVSKAKKRRKNKKKNHGTKALPNDREQTDAGTESETCPTPDAQEAPTGADPLVVEFPAERKTLRMKEDVMKDIFRVQSRVPSRENIINIVSSEIVGGEGFLNIEPSCGNLEDLVARAFGGGDSANDSRYRSFHWRLDWCLQLLPAIKVLHACGVAHGKIVPTNIFFILAEDGGVLIKLGVIANRNVPSLTGPSPSCAFYPSSSHSKQMNPRSNIFAAGCITSMILSGHHIFGLHLDDQLRNVTTQVRQLRRI
jgi:serine/threonine protein kinase